MVEVHRGSHEFEKGFGLPTMTTAERTAFTPPRAGYKVFDSDLGVEFLWNGASWQPSGGGDDGAVEVDLSAPFVLPEALGGQVHHFGINASGIVISTTNNELLIGDTDFANYSPNSIYKALPQTILALTPTGTPINFTQPNGAPVPLNVVISPTLHLSRGPQGGLFNAITQTVGTGVVENAIWYSDTINMYKPLTAADTPTEADMQIALDNAIGSKIVGKNYFQALDTGKVYELNITAWETGNGGAAGNRGYAGTVTEMTPVPTLGWNLKKIPKEFFVSGDDDNGLEIRNNNEYFVQDFQSQDAHDLKAFNPVTGNPPIKRVMVGGRPLMCMEDPGASFASFTAASVDVPVPVNTPEERVFIDFTVLKGSSGLSSNLRLDTNFTAMYSQFNFVTQDGSYTLTNGTGGAIPPIVHLVDIQEDRIRYVVEFRHIPQSFTQTWRWRPAGDAAIGDAATIYFFEFKYTTYNPLTVNDNLIFRVVNGANNTGILPSGNAMINFNIPIVSHSVNDYIWYDNISGKFTIKAPDNADLKLEASIVTTSASGTSQRSYYFRDITTTVATVYGTFGIFGVGNIQYSAKCVVPAGTLITLQLRSSGSSNNQVVKADSFIKATTDKDIATLSNDDGGYHPIGFLQNKLDLVMDATAGTTNDLSGKGNHPTILGPITIQSGAFSVVNGANIDLGTATYDRWIFARILPDALNTSSFLVGNAGGVATYVAITGLGNNSIELTRVNGVSDAVALRVDKYDTFLTRSHLHTRFTNGTDLSLEIDKFPAGEYLTIGNNLANGSFDYRGLIYRMVVLTDAPTNKELRVIREWLENGDQNTLIPTLEHNFVGAATGIFTIHKVNFPTPLNFLANATGPTVNLGYDLTSATELQIKLYIADNNATFSPWQPVYIDVDAMLANYNANASLDHYLNIYDNDWVRVEVVDPTIGEIRLTEVGRDFVLLKAHVLADAIPLKLITDWDSTDARIEGKYAPLNANGIILNAPSSFTAFSRGKVEVWENYIVQTVYDRLPSPTSDHGTFARRVIVNNVIQNAGNGDNGWKIFN